MLCVVLLGAITTLAFAAGQSPDEAIEGIAELAEAEWLDGNPGQALHILDPGLETHPNAVRLQKLRADILATASRRHQEAVEAYDVILDGHPESLEVRWAKWSVLLRAGQQDQAIGEFQRIAQLDVNNPIVALRLAQELRKVDRLEESLEWYEKAVDMIPDMVGWRLALARAKLDVLDGAGPVTKSSTCCESSNPALPKKRPPTACGR